MNIRFIYFILAAYLIVLQPANLFAQNELATSEVSETVLDDSDTQVEATDRIPALHPTSSIAHITAVATAKPQLAASLPPVDFSSSLLSMAKGLAICISVLLVVVWILKKLKSPIITGQGRALRIIEKLPVSAKSSILLVEVNKKRLLIGVGSDPVSLISDFVDSDAMEPVHVGDIKDDSHE